jgi:hypothetical protein
MNASSHEQSRFAIDPQSVAAARAELAEVVRGIPIAEAALEGFSDWEVVEAMERLWAGAMVDQDEARPNYRSVR